MDTYDDSAVKLTQEEIDFLKLVLPTLQMTGDMKSLAKALSLLAGILEKLNGQSV